METRQFLLRTELDADALGAWIEAGWLAPGPDREMLDFSETDLARAMLIRDLKEKLGISNEGVPIVLDLVDQLHGLRRLLRHVLSTIETQPEATRHKIVAQLREACGFERTAGGQ